MWWAREVNPISGDCLASSAIRCCRVDTRSGFDAPAMFPSNDSMTWHPLPSPGSRRLRFPCFDGTTRCSDVRRSFPPRFVAFAWRYHWLHPRFVPGAAECARAGLELVSRCPAGKLPWRTQDLPGSWGTPCPYALFFDPGRTEHARPLRRVGMAPAMTTAKAPARFQLSRLNRTALGLAVYASPRAVTRTRRKTRFRPLAKRYRTGLVTRRVPSKGFRIASCDSSSFPKLSWRKAIQRLRGVGIRGPTSAASRADFWS